MLVLTGLRRSNLFNMVLVLAVIFRRLKWVVIPLFSCSLGVAYTLGILGYLDWRMTVISSNVVAVLLIVGLAIAIHLVVRYRELHRIAPDGPLYDRVRDAMRLMAVPCIYTGVTTMVAKQHGRVWSMIETSTLSCLAMSTNTLRSSASAWPSARAMRHRSRTS